MQVIKVSNGVEMMTKITAAGCSVTAVACAFITAAPQQALLATAFALSIYGYGACSMHMQNDKCCEAFTQVDMSLRFAFQ